MNPALKTPVFTNEKEKISRRKIVVQLMDEINKDSVLYNGLIAEYIESLDSGAKRLILDVKTRMQKSKFSEHMRQRLIRFMIEREDVEDSYRLKLRKTLQVKT